MRFCMSPFLEKGATSPANSAALSGGRDIGTGYPLSGRRDATWDNCKAVTSEFIIVCHNALA